MLQVEDIKKVCLAEMSDISKWNLLLVNKINSWWTKVYGTIPTKAGSRGINRERKFAFNNTTYYTPIDLFYHILRNATALDVKFGMFIYDNLARRKVLRKSEKINLNKASEGKELKDNFAQGFEYSDCWVEDSRLVLLNARDAYLRGARIMTRSRSCEPKMG